MFSHPEDHPGHPRDPAPGSHEPDLPDCAPGFQGTDAATAIPEPLHQAPVSLHVLLRVTCLPLDPSASMPGSPTLMARPHVQTPPARSLQDHAPSLPNPKDLDLTFKMAHEAIL